MKNVAVFASGNGSNFEALIKEQYDNAKIILLVCDNSLAFVIKRAQKYNIETLVLNTKDFAKKSAYEEEILKILKERQIDLICLAGYMRIVGSTILNNFKNKIINIHPALLPAFKGAHAIKDAYTYGVKIMGVTIHYVDETIDGGKIIDQDCFYVNNLTYEEVEEKIHTIEHQLYPKVLKEVTR